MAIREVSGSEVVLGAVAIREVEISEEFVRSVVPAPFVSAGWELQCQACDAYDTGLGETEARAAMATHVCPDVPPCAEVE